jgi:Fe-S cluster assembly ATPase SufC
MSLKLIMKTRISKFVQKHNECKKVYQSRINIIKDENGNLLTHSQRVLNRWKNLFNHVLNVHGSCVVTGEKNSPTVAHACRKRQLKWVLPQVEGWSTGLATLSL